ncbi:hypothetical protein M9434_006305 [Picochlorum sp. BPE23]|nr:hypothetical protein M9434_006305 [Picochlorum sp. BPE23]
MSRLFYAQILLLLTYIIAFNGVSGNNDTCSASSEGPGSCAAETGGPVGGPVPPSVCFVVRTYWGHGDEHGGELRSFLKSLKDQDEQNWEAVFVVADKKPFPEMYTILESMNETRAWVFAEWIGEDYTPKIDGAWANGYHGTLYNMTDDAIRLCSPSTTWVVVTNGDNLYGRSFISTILATADEDTDLVSFDFYSRFNRPTMPPCDRFTPEYNHGHNCKRNNMVWCQVDLGSVAINRTRLMKEYRYFGELTYDYGVDESHNDGLMFQELLQDGWKIKRVEDECLFVHSPSIQSCGWNGGVWDDRDILYTGGDCISQEEADRILLEDSTIEKVDINVIHAGNYKTEYADARISIDGTVGCLRKKDALSASVWGVNAHHFGKGCTDKDDHERLENILKHFGM